jgi:HEAT repeat protein
MGLFGPPDIDRLAQKQDVNGLIRALAYSQAHTRVMAARKMGDLKDHAFVEPLMDCVVGDGDLGVKAQALTALMNIEDPRVIPFLVTLAERLCALDAMAKSSRKGADYRPFLEAVIVQLGATSDVRAIPALARLLEDTQGLAEPAAKALTRCGDPAVPALIEAHRPSNSTAVEMALAEIANPRAIAFLGEAADENPQAGAAWREARYNRAKRTKDQHILLEIAHDDPLPDVRRAAVGNLEDRAGLAEIAAHDSDESVRRMAIGKLSSAVVLGTVVRDEPSEALRAFAVERLQDDAVLGQIARSHPSLETRRVAIAKLNDQAVLEAIAFHDAEELRGDARARIVELQTDPGRVAG